MQSSHGDLACRVGVFSEVVLLDQMGTLSFSRAAARLTAVRRLGVLTSRQHLCFSNHDFKDVGFILSEIR